MKTLVPIVLCLLSSFAFATAPGIDAYQQGKFEDAYKQFQDTLARFGLKAIEARGQVFDPNLHQAVSTVPTDDVAENTVVDELRKGYTLNGKLLRPVMVSVAVRN